MTKNAPVKIAAAAMILWPLFIQAAPNARGLNEDAAINALLRALQRDHVYDKRISLDCVTFDTDNTTRTYFEIALREKHNKKCGGDPETSPVVDRYRVNRASGKIELYDSANDSWKPYAARSSDRRP
jgi:hypothetical protein